MFRKYTKHLISIGMLLKIPLKPHVKAFLTSPEFFGEEPLSSRKDSLIGTAILMVCSQQPIDLLEWYGDRLAPEPINDAVYLTIETSFPIREEHVDENNLLYVGNMLEFLVEYFIIFFTMGYCERMGSERGAIRVLHHRFGIEDDPIKEEAMRSMSKRYRDKVRANYMQMSKKNPTHFAKKVAHLPKNEARKLNF